ncbi:MAG: hypothetical protein ACRBF0_14545 [Calditrichia bacterium]
MNSTEEKSSAESTQTTEQVPEKSSVEAVQSSEQALEQLKPSLVAYLEQRLDEWYGMHDGKLTSYSKNLNAALDRVNQRIESEGTLEEVWQELLKYSRELVKWCKGLHYVPDELPAREFFGSFIKQSIFTLRELPEEALFATPLPNGKWWNPFDKAVIENFPQHAFIRLHLFQPFQRVLLREWSEFLYEASKDLNEIYEIDRSVNQLLLLLQNAEQVWIRNQALDLVDHIREQRGLTEKITETLRGTTQSKAAAMERFETWWQTNSELFRKEWENAQKGELKPASYSQSKLREKNAELTANFNRDRNAWKIHTDAESQSWEQEIALFSLQLTIGCEYLRLNATFRQKIEEDMKPVLAETGAIIKESVAKFAKQAEAAANKSGDADGEISKVELRKQKRELRRAIAKENRQLVNLLRNEILPNIMDTLLRSKLSLLMRGFQQEVKSAIEILPPKQTILRVRDKENKPPRSSVDDVQIKEIIENEFFLSFDNELTEFRKKLSRSIEKMLLGISEIDEIVEFNLDAALGMLEQEDGLPEARKMLTEGLERAGGKINLFIDRFDKMRVDSEGAIFELARTFCVRLQDLRDSEKLLALQVQVMQAKARQRLLQWRKDSWRFLKSVWADLWRSAKSLGTEIRAWWVELMRTIGLMNMPDMAGETLAHFLSETNQRIDNLPYVYQRLFQLLPLEDERFFSGRDKELEVIRSDFQNWKNGMDVTTIIVGEKGSGRTTLINFAMPLFEDEKTYRVDFTETLQDEKTFMKMFKAGFPDVAGDSWEDLEKQLVEREEPVVLIVENIQNLFLKTVDGFQLLERFMMLIIRSSKQVFWIFSCNRYSWDYLDRVLKFGRYFGRVLSLGGLQKEMVEDILIKRHRVTGYRLVFDIPGKIKRQRKFRKMMREGKEQVYLREMFFEQLQEISAGNISVAMLYWLRAIQKITEEELVLNPVIDFDYSFVFQMEGDELFTLGALVQHDMLEIHEHASVFHQEQEKSLSILRALSRRGILLDEPTGFRIHPFLYRPVVRALTMRNILH